MFKKLVLPVLMGLVCAGFTVFMSGAAGAEASGALIDLPSFIIAIIFPFLIVLASFGFAKTRAAFGVPFDPEASSSELKMAKAWFASFLRYIVAFSVFAFSIGFVMVMVYASGKDSSIVGKNIAIAILSIFYGAIVPVFFALPFIQAIDMKLAELDK